jgi:Glyoxalase-like domain
MTDVDWNFQLAQQLDWHWPMALRRQGSLTVYFKIQVVIDAAEPAKLAEFWALALDYVLEPPPHGFETWEDFGRSIGMPEEKFGDQAAVIDPADEGPRLFFQRVPERKTSGAKNRVHLDVRVGDREVQGEERKQLMSEKVEQLVEAGASVAWVNENVGGHSIVLRDPEGNEFCVA